MSARRMRHGVYVLLALLLPVLVAGLGARRLTASATSASSSEHDANDGSAPQDNQDPVGIEQLTLFAACAAVTPPATTGHRFFRLPAAARRTSRAAPMPASAPPSTSASPLRC